MTPIQDAIEVWLSMIATIVDLCSEELLTGNDWLAVAIPSSNSELDGTTERCYWQSSKWEA